MAQETGGRPEYQNTPAFLDQIYKRACAVDLLNQEFLKIPRNEQPQDDGINVITEGSFKYRLLRELLDITYTNMGDFDLPSGIQAEDVRDTIPALLTLKYPEAKVREIIISANPDLAAHVNERFDFLKRNGSIELTFGVAEYARALNELDWDLGISFEQLSDDDFDALADKFLADMDIRLRNPMIVLFDRYPDGCMKWFEKHLMENGDSKAYLMVANLTSIDMLDKYKDLKYIYENTYRFLNSIPNGPLVRDIGQMIKDAGKYAPAEFLLSQKDLETLLANKFEKEEMYDVGCNPQLRNNLLSKKPSESDEDFSSGLDENDIFYQGVNILEYLIYLEATGGVFHPASTKVLGKKIDEQFMSETSTMPIYLVANKVWRRWREAARQHGAQRVLDAWTIAPTLADI